MGAPKIAFIVCFLSIVYSVFSVKNKIFFHIWQISFCVAPEQHLTSAAKVIFVMKVEISLFFCIGNQVTSLEVGKNKLDSCRVL